MLMLCFGSNTTRKIPHIRLITSQSGIGDADLSTYPRLPRTNSSKIMDAMEYKMSPPMITDAKPIEFFDRAVS